VNLNVFCITNKWNSEVNWKLITVLVIKFPNLLNIPMLIHENNIISIKVRFLMPQTYGFNIEDVKIKKF